MKSFRVFAALLSYPEEELQASLPELTAALDEEHLLDAEARGPLDSLISELERGSLTAVQEDYVALFDRSRALSLHLFEHVYGESRDRGQAMVDLAATYRSRGIALVGNELPDYLPAFLEFVSLRPPAEARGMLAEAADVLRAIGERLAERDSRYAAVFAALLSVAGEPGLGARRSGDRKPAPRDTREALDRDWAEPPVNFGGGSNPCAAGPAPPRAAREGTAS